MTGLFGGAFDPPHLGHVALLEAAKRHFGLDRVVILVAARPGHKDVATPVDDRLALARAAFPDDEVRLDENARTVDLLRKREWDAPLFLIGADQFAGFLAWREPEEVLRLARLGVGTRPGFERERLDAILAQLDQPERVEIFELEPHALASTDLRGGVPFEGAVPPAVAALIEERGLYRPSSGTTLGTVDRGR